MEENRQHNDFRELELQREQLIIKLKMHKARKQGFVEAYYKVDDLEWIDQCTYDQLMRIDDLIPQRLNYKQFKEEILK
ncbi:hypothetical protein [Candidatus Stoquefichus massiliensis]|uniref:hypothetical protein n=1 Tax=Candidatus Stoquefichus massiliensis TaxID=1470350 RepID=UPI0004852115|nr:hypothetical protein [Candidatus Stoquefichus massiliensis]